MILMSLKVHGALFTLVLIGAATACSQTPAPSPSIEGDVPIFVLEEWESLHDVDDPEGQFEAIRMSAPRDFSVRHAETSGGDLLLRHDREPIFGLDRERSRWVHTGRFQEFPVYRYDVEKQTLLRASENEWIMADGKIELCTPQTRRVRELRLESRTNELKFNDQTLSTNGALAVLFALPFNRNLVAVVSADGPKARGSLPFGGSFGGSTGAEGQHYHQVFSLQEERFVSGSVRIPLESAWSLQGCWSPDDRLVLYLQFNKLVVVPVDEHLVNRRAPTPHDYSEPPVERSPCSHETSAKPGT